jgi:hypothetical protein
MSLKDVLKMMAELEPEELDALVKTMTEGQAEKAEPVVEVSKRPPRRKTKKGGKTDEVRNKFEDSPIFNQCKEDIEMDKKLWGNREPSVRRTPAKKIKIECMQCNKMCEVNKDEVFFMSSNEYSYTCPKCQNRRARR